MSGQGIEILVAGRYGFYPLYYLLLNACSLWFLRVFPIVISFDRCFHALSAPSSFCCYNIRFETQSRACVDVCQGPG